MKCLQRTLEDDPAHIFDLADEVEIVLPPRSCKITISVVTRVPELPKRARRGALPVEVEQPHHPFPVVLVTVGNDDEFDRALNDVSLFMRSLA